MEEERNFGSTIQLEGGGCDSVFETQSTRSLCSADNNLRFLCKLHIKRCQQKEQETVQVDVELPGRCSVHQLRLRICIQAQKTTSHPDPLSLLDPEKYQLLYTKGDDLYEIYDDHQVLRTLDITWLDANGARMANIVVKPQPEDTEERQSTHQTLAYLIGHDLNAAAPERLGEMNFARRKFVSSRKEELQRRNPRVYAMEPWVTSTPFLKDQQALLSGELLGTLYHGEVCLQMRVDITKSPASLIEIVLKIMSENGNTLEQAASDLVLKVCGREEFLTGDFPLSDFLWVRHCLKTMQGLHLSVHLATSFEEETVREEGYPIVDSFAGLCSSHEELTLANKEVDDILMISLWDCARTLRVKLLGFDIPQLPCKAPQNVHVEAFILYGNMVVSSVCSPPRPFAKEVLWNMWLEFDVLLKNIPRGAKLGFTINATTLDSSAGKSTFMEGKEYQKGKGKVLFFVNILLIDHRSLLSQGLHTLHMWPFLEKEEEVFTYQADKLSSATNPDQANSMAITFLLDRYSFPVVLPQNKGFMGISSTPRVTDVNNTHLASFAVSSEDVISQVSAREGKSGKSDKLHLRRFREESALYGSNLPQYLRKVNWLKPSTVQDVHWLLCNWDPQDLEVPIALELLSVDFADEQVRKLAVKRLETLSNEEVLRYLLQLVQTLKVEAYHDSYLAGFLIQRALRSKRIGHYFFWYLRSEVSGCPYFRERLAVTLEAYLLGCGQAMLTSFLSQVQLVESLHRVTIEVKKLFPDKTDLPANAGQQLQALLQTCTLPPDFQVPFDPRIRAGPIMLEKCKIMASKKKPLWLEFSCPVSQGPPSSPVGIIFKHGDDLRQDMLIIQTLTLMDSVWQEKSLDLNLVPYGCISTGHNIGMIEIVRDSVTIATIQRSRGGTTGAFKNDALYEWLKGRSLLQEIHYQAMERFVTSCAGYCVATYVLGIGDRHNDNIMISEQGNLFHIDFGHILGNTKRFFGVNRERAPFVLTPDFLYVMGNKSSLYFQRFKDTCIQAYIALRSHTRLLVTLFSLMLLTGIPELSCAQDIHYLRYALQEERNEEEARDHFLQQIATCEQLGWTVQANWWIHMLAGIK